MAINNNVQNVKFLRNGSLYQTHDEAYEALTGFNLTAEQDGTAILARYTSTDDNVKTLVGWVYSGESGSYVTIQDVEGASADVEALRQEINAKLGEGVTSTNTATAQFTALSGTSSDASGVTSVWGAKRYADQILSDAIDSFEYTGVTTGNGVYVTNVTESDGVISATTATLPTVDDTAVNLKFVTEVDETLGTISVSRGEITSSNKTISLSANTDGGVDFKANVDGTTIIIDENTGTMSVASTALTQYVGDEKTIHITSADSQNNKTVSSLLSISATTASEANVKEQYNLVNASGETIGATIKIYKDSALLSVALLHAVTGATEILPTYDKATNTWTDIDSQYQTQENQALCYAYENVEGTVVIAAVPVGSFINEQEFASGVTWDTTENKVVGVVDTTSEPFLTVGADGFKLAGVQNAIGTAVEALDATVNNNANSGHVAVEIVETDGKLVSVTVTEDDIASAGDLAELSAKTVTGLTSTNGSITASIDDAAGCKTYNIETDASKIKMSGFTSTEVLSGIVESSSITEAFSEVDKVITENEEVTAAALNDLDTRIKELSSGSTEALEAEIEARQRVDGITGSAYTATAGANYISEATSLNDADQKLDAAIDNIANNYVSGITVNGSGLTVANNIAAVTVTPATSATTATSTEAITVTTDEHGNITLGLANIDCGTY